MLDVDNVIESASCCDQGRFRFRDLSFELLFARKQRETVVFLFLFAKTVVSSGSIGENRLSRVDLGKRLNVIKTQLYESASPLKGAPETLHASRSELGSQNF
jgi:hypothetical protein